MARQLNITDGEAVLTVDETGPGPVPATIHAIDPVRLTRRDIRTLIAFLESLDD